MRSETKGKQLWLYLEGELSAQEATTLHKELKSISGHQEVILDFSAVESFDSSIIAVISICVEELAQRNIVLHVENITDAQEEALALMPAKHDNFGLAPEKESILFTLGESTLKKSRDVLLYIRFCARIALETFRIMFMGKRYAKGELTNQSVAIGVNAFPIIALCSVLIGLVLGFQAAAQMTEFGGIEYVANLVGVGMAREFGPLMTAIVLAGRSGSAMAAELGTMQVQEELDALRVMGLDPERYLVVPRMFAIIIMGPGLTLLSILLGIFGGMLIGVFYVDMTALFYAYRTITAVGPNDIWHGVWKSFVFSYLIGSIACYCGMQIQGGASGVGKATTKAVVMSIFMIIFADSIATGLSTVVGGWL